MNNELEVEGVFLIVANNKDVFLSRKHRLQQESGFYTAGDNSYEKPAQGIYRIITMGVFDDMDAVRSALKSLQAHSWFFATTLLIDGKEIYSDGEWIANSALDDIRKS